MQDRPDNALPHYFRSISELEDTPAFRAWADREFPAMAMELDRRRATGELSRRRFLQLMAASASLAGLGAAGGCRRQEQPILPYTKKPSEIVPGVPLYYATTWTLDGQAVGVLAQCREGRPIKLEGNPKHPASRGALPALAQAEILNLYDPDRSRFAAHEGRPVAMDEVLAMLDRVHQQHRADRGGGLAVLIGRHCSPAIDLLAQRLVEAMPEALWCEWSPLPEPTAGRIDLADADVIVSLDCDLLGTDDPTGQLQRQWARRRDPDAAMNRLYAVEPHLTVTGMKADHRLALRASELPRYALALEAAVRGEAAAPPAGVDAAWISAVAADLLAHRGRAVVLAGRTQPEATHEAAARINEALGWANGPAQPTGDALSPLHERLEAGRVQTLVILDANPVFAAALSEDLLGSIPTTLHMGLYRDETALACHWHVPMAHFLERWGDAHDAVGGAYSPLQPMIDPLLGGVNPLFMLARLAGLARTEPYQIVRDSFRRLTGDADFESRWRLFLHEGVVAGVDRPRPAVAPTRSSGSPIPDPDAIELVLSPDYSVYDGRFANNGWLQEMPDPVTKLVWDNAAIMGPSTAARLGVQHGELVTIRSGAAELTIAAMVAPGSAEGSIRLPLGYGRTAGASLGRHAGFNVSALRRRDQAWIVPADAVTPAGRRYELATTQEHWSIEQIEALVGTFEDRAIIREASLAHYREHPDFARHMGLHVPHHEDIHATPAFTAPQQWGMTIDLNKCTGCSACVVACQAENNIPIVGKDEVLRGREMHWMRIDRYYRPPTPEAQPQAAADVPGAAVMPMLCQHCENAPCEPVCPVNATVHDEQGLNVMVYNRCVGTRYCSNNCPYKVRRFNFLNWNKDIPEIRKMVFNPDVTVRMRGVMEKCNYCVQRIEEKRSQAKAEGRRPIRDGEIVTACQQACPADAIVFGNINDPESRVSKLKQQARDYSVLEELNTKPRTTYLARVRNPNPELV